MTRSLAIVVLLAAAGIVPAPAEATDRPITVALHTSESRLSDPAGFDVDYRELSNTGPEGVSLHRRHPLANRIASHRRDELSVDFRDFKGLSILGLSLGQQLRRERATGRIRPSAGLGVAIGASRLESYTDDAWTAHLEANASIGVRWTGFGVELGMFARESASATLDERSASPAIRGIRFSLIFGRFR